MTIVRQPTRFETLLVCLLATNAALATTLNVTPSTGLIDTPFIVQVGGARPGAKVRIQADLEDAKGQHWTAIGEYRADPHGRVDTASAESLGGTYQGQLPGGLACTGLPVAPSALPKYIDELRTQPGPTKPDFGTETNFAVRVTADVQGKLLGPVTVTRTFLTPGVSVVEAQGRNWRGIYAEPATGPRGIPVVIIGGSGGGLVRNTATLLASHGHPALSLAYFAYKDLPPALFDIPLEAFADGAAWLKGRTGASGVVLMGTSRGSEAVLLTAAYLPESIVGVIAVVPSPLVHGGIGQEVDMTLSRAAWTLDGYEIPHAHNRVGAVGEADLEQDERDYAVQSKGPPGYVGTPAFLRLWNDPLARELYGIPVEKIRVPMLLLGGEADTMWPSAVGVKLIRERMIAHGKRDLVEAHTYPDAGHGMTSVGVANELSGYIVHSLTRTWFSTGGRPEANCRAGYDLWAQMLEFLQRRAPAAAPMQQH